VSLVDRGGGHEVVRTQVGVRLGTIEDIGGGHQDRMPHGDGAQFVPRRPRSRWHWADRYVPLERGAARADSMSAVRSHFEPLWVFPASDRARAGASLGGSLRARRPHSRGRAADRVTIR
jgi:hypothetical protein